MNPFQLIWPVVLIAIAVYAYLARKKAGQQTASIPSVNPDKAKELIQHGIKVHVDYAQCIITDRSYSYEQETESGRIAGMNVLSGDEMSNVQLQTQYQLLLEYPYSREYTGETIIYQIPVYMAKDSLDMRFIANDIYLYIDKPDYKACLLDFGDRQMWGERKT